MAEDGAVLFILVAASDGFYLATLSLWVRAAAWAI